jgi:hypothetical protein
MRPYRWVFVLLLAAGCGGDGSDDPGPSEQEIFLVQRSGDASAAMTRVFEAANAAVLASGSGSSYTPGPHAVPVFPGATPAFDYSADVDILIDFDAEDGDGNDLDPSASGQVRVTALGTTSGDASAGTATFSVEIAAETDLVLDDSERGTETTVPAGASWSYLLIVEWTEEDSHHWSVTATATTTVDVQDVVVDDGETVVTVDILGERIVTSSFSRNGGGVRKERTFEGSLATSVDDGVEIESVVFEWTKPGHVRISVLGHVFGPMTDHKVRSLFRTLIN